MSRSLAQDLTTKTQRLGAELTLFAEQERYLHTGKVLRLGIFGWLLLQMILLFPYQQHFWSPEAMVLRRAFDPSSWYDWLFYLIAHPAIQAYYRLFSVALIAVLIAGLSGYRVWLMTLAAWLLNTNLANHANVIQDGGNNLCELLLTYMLFINASGVPWSSKIPGVLRTFLVTLSNGGLLLCRLQVFAVYVSAGVFKLNGELWQHGMALFYILQSQSYTHPVWGRLLVDHAWLATMGTYFAVIFQASFPFLVWPRKTRPVILLCGVMLHLGIAFVMGLLTFGLFMCVSYLAFFPDEWARSLLEPVQLLKRVLKYLAPSLSLGTTAGGGVA